MRPSQPVADTFTLLAGGHIKGAPQLGEERPTGECVIDEVRSASGSRLGGWMLHLGSLLRLLMISQSTKSVWKAGL